MRALIMRPARRLVVLLLLGCGLWLGVALNASAHVIPSSSVQLVMTDVQVAATVSIPVSDLAAATTLDLSDAASVQAERAPIETYLRDHVEPATAAGQQWTVALGDLGVTTAGDPLTTGRYQQVVVSMILTPPAGAPVDEFDLGYTAVVDTVATHTVIVTLADHRESASAAAYEIGVIKRDTVTNTVIGLRVEAGTGQRTQGFAGMVGLGMQHIAEGTDHQLFLLTLLLPAPLIAVGRRWAQLVGSRRAVHRIATVTLAFTLGHSLTLALGALGVPAPQGLVEAMIAVSILVAAAHAIRPIFPGREAVVAACFGLVHGLAFSQTLRELDLSGGQLVAALLGFNLGIELMQLAVVALVLPPLIMLARTGRYRTLRLTAAGLTAVAALGWLAARLGLANPVADLADQLGTIGIPVVIGLWVAAVLLTVASAQRLTPAETGVAGHRRGLGPVHGAELQQDRRGRVLNRLD